MVPALLVTLKILKTAEGRLACLTKAVTLRSLMLESLLVVPESGTADGTKTRPGCLGEVVGLGLPMAFQSVRACKFLAA